MMRQLKAIIDMGDSLRQYAKVEGLGIETINAAAELQLRAERSAGRWLSLYVD